jgi:ATP-dependent Clp protease ATP-binding subunit ClpC
MKNKVNDELKKHFRPEFLNRIDDIVVFLQLTQEQIITLVDLMIIRVESALADKDMAIELTPAAKGRLARRGWDPVLVDAVGDLDDRSGPRPHDPLVRTDHAEC